MVGKACDYSFIWVIWFRKAVNYNISVGGAGKVGKADSTADRSLLYTLTVADGALLRAKKLPKGKKNICFKEVT